MTKEIKKNYMDMMLKSFSSAQKDLQDCWHHDFELTAVLKHWDRKEENCYTGDWRLGADPETNYFCKMIHANFSEDLTFAETVKHIRDSYDLTSLYYNIKCNIATKNMPDIGV
jgi:hypothetical protein